MKPILQKLTPRLDHTVPDISKRGSKEKIDAFLKAIEAEEASIRLRTRRK